MNFNALITMNSIYKISNTSNSKTFYVNINIFIKRNIKYMISMKKLIPREISIEIDKNI